MLLISLLHCKNMLKPSEHRMGENGEKKLNCTKTLNNCTRKHTHKVTFAENFTQTRIFFSTPFNLRGNHFLVHGTENRFTLIYMHFSSFQVCCHNMWVRDLTCQISWLRLMSINYSLRYKYLPTQNSVL